MSLNVCNSDSTTCHLIGLHSVNPAYIFLNIGCDILTGNVENVITLFIQILLNRFRKLSAKIFFVTLTGLIVFHALTYFLGKSGQFNTGSIYRQEIKLRNRRALHSNIYFQIGLAFLYFPRCSTSGILNTVKDRSRSGNLSGLNGNSCNIIRSSSHKLTVFTKGILMLLIITQNNLGVVQTLILNNHCGLAFAHITICISSFTEILILYLYNIALGNLSLQLLSIISHNLCLAIKIIQHILRRITGLQNNSLKNFLKKNNTLTVFVCLIVVSYISGLAGRRSKYSLNIIFFRLIRTCKFLI